MQTNLEMDTFVVKSLTILQLICILLTSAHRSTSREWTDHVLYLVPNFYRVVETEVTERRRRVLSIQHTAACIRQEYTTFQSTL